MTDALRDTARSLVADLAASEAVAALRDAGVRAVLLKGPSIHRLLYADGAARPYRDSDLLVAPDRVGEARAVLGRLGYDRPVEPAPHAEVWTRHRDRAQVDLHWTLLGVGVPPAGVWRALAGITETIELGGARCEVLSPPAVALHLALHAAQHGPTNPQAVTDVDRAAVRLDRSTWRDATALARRLEAVEPFAAGLRLSQPGARLAVDLRLPERVSVETALSARHQRPVSFGLARLAETRTVRGKLTLLVRELVPPRSFMRDWWPPARRGGRWMLVAYARRPVWLLAHVGPALVSWRRAAADSRRSGWPS